MILMRLEIQTRKGRPPRSAKGRQALGRALSGGRLGEVTFLRRQRVGPYVVDFYAPKLRLAVEIDEPRDVFSGDRAEQRQAHLATFGVRSVRLTEEAVAADLEGCLHRVAEAIRTIRDLS